MRKDTINLIWVTKHPMIFCLSWIAILAITIFSCSHESESFHENTIQFNSFIEDTRIQETTTDNIDNFRVSAIWYKNADIHDPNFMNKTLVNRQGNTWEYSPIRYWPTYGVIDFFAYSPGESSGLKSFEITPDPSYHPYAVTIDYDVTTDHQQQEDFLVANAIEMTSNPSLQFKHVLSHIAFKIKAIEDIQLRNITLYNLVRQATLMGKMKSTWEFTWEWSGNNEPLKRTAIYPINMPTPIAVSANTITDIDSFVILPQTYEQGANGNSHNPPDLTDRKICIAVTYDYFDTSSSSVKTETDYFRQIPTLEGVDEFTMGNKYTFVIQLPQTTTRSTRSRSLEQTIKDAGLSVEVTKLNYTTIEVNP